MLRRTNPMRPSTMAQTSILSTFSSLIPVPFAHVRGRLKPHSVIVTKTSYILSVMAASFYCCGIS